MGGGGWCVTLSRLDNTIDFTAREAPFPGSNGGYGCRIIVPRGDTTAVLVHLEFKACTLPSVDGCSCVLYPPLSA